MKDKFKISFSEKGLQYPLLKKVLTKDSIDLIQKIIGHDFDLNFDLRYREILPGKLYDIDTKKKYRDTWKNTMKQHDMNEKRAALKEYVFYKKFGTTPEKFNYIDDILFSRVLIKPDTIFGLSRTKLKWWNHFIINTGITVKSLGYAIIDINKKVLGTEIQRINDPQMEFDNKIILILNHE
jgi:hypothetical protein